MLKPEKTSMVGLSGFKNVSNPIAKKVIKKETGETTAIVWCIRNSQSPFSICLPLLEDFERVIEDEVEENSIPNIGEQFDANHIVVNKSIGDRTCTLDVKKNGRNIKH